MIGSLAWLLRAELRATIAPEVTTARNFGKEGHLEPTASPTGDLPANDAAIGGRPTGTPATAEGASDTAVVVDSTTGAAVGPPDAAAATANRSPGTAPVVLGWALGALVVAAVLAFDPGGWTPFTPAKWWLVSAIGFGLAAGLALTGRVRVEPRSALIWLGLLAWLAVTAAFGVDPVYAWTGTPERHLGFAAWVLFALLFLAGQQFQTVRDAAPVIGGCIVGAAGITAYTVVELLDAEPVDLAASDDRLTGLFGSAAILGAAGVLLLPVVAGSALERTWPAWARLAAGAAAVGTLVTIVGSQTRGAWIGLAAAAAAALWAGRRWLAEHRRATAWLGVAALVVVAAAAVATPVGDRLADAFDDGARSRTDEWRVGLRALGQHPIVGAGPEGYRIEFADAVDAGYERAHGREVMPDRAHNGVLDVALAGGVPAAVLYIGLLVSLAPAVLRALRSPPWQAGLGCALVGYVVQQQFLFPLSEVDPLFWILAGVVVGSTTGVGGMRVVRGIRPAAVALGAIAGVAFVAGAADVVADRAADAALGGRGDPERAADVRPDVVRYRMVGARLLPTTEALAEIDAALDVSPRDPIVREERARLLTQRSSETGDDADIAVALAAWADLVADDPNNARYHLNLGAVQQRAGDLDAAIASWRTAADLAPGDPRPVALLDEFAP
jgi:O-antigen ligase